MTRADLVEHLFPVFLDMFGERLASRAMAAFLTLTSRHHVLSRVSA